MIRNILIVVAACLVFAGTFVLKNVSGNDSPQTENQENLKPEALPRLVDLGSDKCIPCKKMAPMLGVTLKTASSSWAYGVILLLCYGIGHCSVIVLAGTSAQRVQRYLNWNEGSRGHSLLRQACGVLVIAGGGNHVFFSVQQTTGTILPAQI